MSTDEQTVQAVDALEAPKHFMKKTESKVPQMIAGSWIDQQKSK